LGFVSRRLLLGGALGQFLLLGHTCLAGEAFFGGAFLVQVEEAGEDFVAEVVGPAQSSELSKHTWPIRAARTMKFAQSLRRFPFMAGKDTRICAIKSFAVMK
jgi:hypothetical protein